jgi:hypothetical protein
VEAGWIGLLLGRRGLIQKIIDLLRNEEVINMDEKRKGEIALALLKYRMFREGIRFTPNIKRELGNIAKVTGIPQDELKEFGRILIKELLEETFGK